MTFEVPLTPREKRRAAIWRWVTTILVLALIGVIGYLGYVGYDGSREMVEPPANRDCRTPQSAFGWSYEAVNYDRATDAARAAAEDPLNCDVEGGEAGEELTSNDGVPLAAWYIPSSSGSGATGDTLILVHDFGGSKAAMLDLAELFHSRFNLVLFDQRNHGQSGRAATTQGSLEQRDLRAVVEWVTTTKEPEHLGVLGVGMGGTAAANMVATDLRVHGVVLESTPATLANAAQARLEQRRLPLSLPGAWAVLLGGLLRTGQDMSAADAIQAVERLEIPVLLVAAGDDQRIGPSDPADMLAAAEAAGVDAELQTCEGAAHGDVVGTCPDDYRSWVQAFLARAFAAAP